MSAQPWSGPRRVLVTGGGTGIGLGIVGALRQREVEVIAIGRRKAPLECAQKLGADTLTWDVTHDPETLLRRIGHVDGLVHNAGVCIRQAIGQWSPEDWASLW